jgi:hypothetical protein
MPMPRKSVPVKQCAQCGADLHRKTYNGRLEDRPIFLRRKYCDLTCAGRAHRKPDQTGQEARSRKRSRHLLKPVCEACGTAQLLQTHHLDGDPRNNEPSNVQTLCASCHARWHWQHGKTPRRPKPCVVCGQPSRRAGMCQKHYQRFHKYGDPLLTKRHIGRPYCLVRLSPLD